MNASYEAYREAIKARMKQDARQVMARKEEDVRMSQDNSLAVVSSGETSSTMTRATIGKNDTLAVLNKIQDILLLIVEKYTKIERVNSQIQDGNNKMDSIRTKVGKYWFWGIFGFIGLGIIGEFGVHFFKTIFSTIVGIIRGALGASGALGLIGVIAFLIFCTHKLRITSNKEAEQYYKEHIMPIEKERFYLQQALQNYLQSSEVTWAIGIVTKTYFNYNIVGTFIKYIKSGRADSLKEAINLYEEEQHRARIEAMQQSSTNAAWETAKSSREIANSAAAAAADIEKIRKSVEDIEWNLRWNY